MAAEQDPTAVQVAAFEWFARLNDRSANARTVRAFQHWLSSDPEHARVCEEIASSNDALEALWLDLKSTRDRSTAWPSIDGAAARRVRATPMPIARQAHPFVARPALLGIAAGLMVVLSVTAALSVSAPTAAAPIAYSSQIGQVRTLLFADGSSVQLDAASRIEVAYSNRERRVALVSGRAYFDVAHERERPFVVATDLGSVRVLGTAFVVEAAPSGVRTTIIRGRVRGEPELNWSAALIARFNGAHNDPQIAGLDIADAHIAGAGEELSFTRSDASADAVTLTRRSRANPNDRLAWRDGVLVFEGATLADACAEVARHTGYTFAFADRRLEEARITAYFEGNDLDRFLLLLAQTGVVAEPIGHHRYMLKVGLERTWDRPAPTSSG